MIVGLGVSTSYPDEEYTEDESSLAYGDDMAGEGAVDVSQPMVVDIHPYSHVDGLAILVVGSPIPA